MSEDQGNREPMPLRLIIGLGHEVPGACASKPSHEKSSLLRTQAIALILPFEWIIICRTGRSK